MSKSQGPPVISSDDITLPQVSTIRHICIHYTVWRMSQSAVTSHCLSYTQMLLMASHFIWQAFGIVKVKCTLAQAMRLCTGCMAHRESRGIALPFLDHSTRRGWGVSVTSRPLFTHGKDLVPIVQEARWAPGFWTGAENPTPTGIRSLDHPARSQSPYRLHYPAQIWNSTSNKHKQCALEWETNKLFRN